MLQDEHSLLGGTSATFALLACGCHTFYVGHDIAPGDPVTCPSPSQCFDAAIHRTAVTSILTGTMRP